MLVACGPTAYATIRPDDSAIDRQFDAVPENLTSESPFLATTNLRVRSGTPVPARDPAIEIGSTRGGPAMNTADWAEDGATRISLSSSTIRTSLRIDRSK